MIAGMCIPWLGKIAQSDRSEKSQQVEFDSNLKASKPVRRHRSDSRIRMDIHQYQRCCVGEDYLGAAIVGGCH